VALHLAAQAIQHGQGGQQALGSPMHAKRALVAGVHVQATPASSLAVWAAGMLSPQGRCQVADAAADGYVRGEAAVTFLLGPGSYVPGVRRAQRYSSPQQHVDGNEADSDSSETDKCASSSSYCQPALLDQPLAIISGTAINQDGRSSSLTAPSGPAQVCSLPRHTFSLLRTAAHVNVVMCPMTAYPNRDPL
jgi:hypothetical protein